MSRKIALITGASRGLGKSSAIKLAESGVDIIITYQKNKAEALTVAEEVEKRGGKAGIVQLDVSQSHTFSGFAEQVLQLLLEKWQRNSFNFLVNNAGIGLHASFKETTEEQFDELMNIHLKGVFFLTQKLLPLIADHGRIINLSTGLTRFSLPGYAAYATMKGGIEVLSKYMAKELGPRGIAVNVLAPGAIETDFGDGLVRDNTELNKFIASQTALGRVGLPDDIGGVIAALLSDECGWINAQRIEASGGIHI